MPLRKSTASKLSSLGSTRVRPASFPGVREVRRQRPCGFSGNLSSSHFLVTRASLLSFLSSQWTLVV